MTRAPEPHLGLVSSVVGNGTRIRAVLNTLYPRPASETFHEFLVDFMKWTFGKAWWMQQVATPTRSQHVVIRWTKAFAVNSRRPPTESVNTEFGRNFATVASAPTRALLTLSYDLYCLRSKDKLSIAMLERLRDRQRFQSARYEVAVACILLRAGFELKLLDEDAWSEKHCEFVATHRATGQRLAIEAKSRVRPGALHEPGELTYTEDVKGLINLVRRASKQGLPAIPLVVFIDVNLPPTPGTPVHKKQWMRDANAVADQRDRRALQPGGGPTPYSLLIMTNFGFQFGNEDGISAPVELSAILPERPCIQLSTDTVNAIVASAQGYSRIPDDV